MLSPKAQLNLKNAREYFREHLSAGDYYAEGEKVIGEWFGEGAEKLNLTGAVGEQEFLHLCEGLHPTSGERLTLRRNSHRQNEDGRSVANRRVFYDFTISPPKSVSVVALCQDARIVALHERAIREAMAELEKFAETRVRKDGERGDRVTGNFLGAAFRHDTSRELDPHLHTHCVVFNATFDRTERCWKALEAGGMYRAQKFIEGLYYHELAKGLRRLGYSIATSPTGFEIKGVPATVIERFSKRHRQINAETEKRINREGLRGNMNDLREQVARDSRKRKMKDSTAERLRPFWATQLSRAERSALESLRPGVLPPRGERANVSEIIAWADAHLFERRSVVNDHELLAAALTRGRGQDFKLVALREALAERDYLRDAGSRQLTSREVLRCELDIVLAAREGRRQYGPLAPGQVPSSSLSAEQRTAVETILGSRHFVTLFSGGAGTGKSHALQEIVRGLVAAGRPVQVLAPQRQQVHDLVKDGLPAETLARALEGKRFPAGAVVIVDEAGQVGGRQLRELIRLVQASRGRLILSGDTRQHGAVAASDALRAIERYAGIKPAVLRSIRRQDPARGTSIVERRFIRSYRAAVKAAAAGDLPDSFARLDRLGCVRELAESARQDALAAEYLAALARKETALIVAQTWAEVRSVNDTVREKLRAGGQLGRGQSLTVYRAIDATEAQKHDPGFYQAGQHAYFIKRYGRYAKGDLCTVAGVSNRGVALIKDGRRSTLSYRYADRVSLVTDSAMEVAPGDRLQLKFNGKSVEGAALANGELVIARRLRRDGSLVVEAADGARKTLAPNQRLFNRGYAVTSYASQGKTVDTVVLADAANQAATNANQWYVAISRGRKRVVVFTSDKAGLAANIQRSGARPLALELNPREVCSTYAEQRTNRQRPAWLPRAWATIQRMRRFAQARKALAQIRDLKTRQ